MKKSDFAIYEKNGDVLSMGYKFENLLKDAGLPAMIGGGKGKYHKNQYGIPVGLALLNKQIDISPYFGLMIYMVQVKVYLSKGAINISMGSIFVRGVSLFPPIFRGGGIE